MNGPERITLAMTGASGAQYGLRLLDCLVREDREVHFLISKAAQLVMATETDVTLPAKPQMMQAFLTEYTGAAAGQIRCTARKTGCRRWPRAPARRRRWWWCRVPPVRCRRLPPAPATT
jgi:Fe-S cluster assembly iron-binding protein IscA